MSKDSERRGQYRAKNLFLSEGIAEPHPIFVVTKIAIFVGYLMGG